MPLILVSIPLVLFSFAIGAAAFLLYRAGRIAGKGVGVARRLPVVRSLPILGVKPAPALPGPDNTDLVAYPARLAALEARLVERHDAVQDQLRVLSARTADLAGKADRADLLVRYEEDIDHLDRRAASMRRVITLVWRTRAILLLRVYLAVTGRGRPVLGALPESRPGVRLTREALAHARASYADSATLVRFYVDTVRSRLAQLSDQLPAAPTAAEVTDTETAAVAEELERTRAAHESLAHRMDRLADNLTWLADHAGTLEVVGDDLEAPPAGPHGESAAHLLGEVESAIVQLNALAAAVDHQLAGRALDQLDDDVGKLETAGLEEQAAAAAELEVARLVEGFSA